MTLNDVGEYKILFKARKNQNDMHPMKKYLSIFITNEIDDENRTELSFETELSSFYITVGQDNEIILPTIEMRKMGLKNATIE